MSNGNLNLEERLSQRIGRASRVRSVAIRFTEEEAQLIEAAAKEDGTTLREWSRAALLGQALRSKDDALFVELIATRMLLLNLLKPLAMGEKLTQQGFAEIAAQVRSEKRKVAQEIQQQYTAVVPREA